MGSSLATADPRSFAKTVHTSTGWVASTVELKGYALVNGDKVGALAGVSVTAGCEGHA